MKTASIQAELCQDTATMERLWQDRKGSIALLSALFAPVLIGVMGLSIDVSYWTAVRLEVQRTADLAAIAGALSYGATNNIQSAAASAAATAELNGAVGAAIQTWDGNTATLSDNQVSVQIVGGLRRASDTAVKVTVQQTVPLWFSRLFTSRNLVTIAATSWAELGRPRGNQPCVLALAADGTAITTGTDVSLSGSSIITLNNCTLRSDASVSIGGNATVLVTSGIYAAGTISVGGSASLPGSPENQNSGQIPDPYANYSPMQGALAQLGSGGQAQPQSPTLNPGAYSSLDFKAAVTLNPGLYVVNGPITFGSQSSVTGTGVTIVSNGAVTMNSGATVDLTAPGTAASNGAVPGILYANAGSGLSLKWNGGSSESFTGVFYVPNSTITINGNAGAGSTGCMEIIAAYVNIQGDASLAANCTDLGALSFGSLPGSVALVQ